MLDLMIGDNVLHLSLYQDSILMKKLLVMFLLLGTLLPSAEAGVSPEGIRSPRPRPRCRTHGQVVVCKMPRPRKRRCTIQRPCIPRDYYRPSPPKRIPIPIPMR